MEFLTKLERLDLGCNELEDLVSIRVLTIWRGVWNKALSDFWCNVKFSSSFTTEYKDIWKENLVIYQKSLKAFLQAPLHLLKLAGPKEVVLVRAIGKVKALCNYLCNPCW